MQKFDFSMKKIVEDLFFFLKKECTHCWLLRFPLYFFDNLRIRANRYLHNSSQFRTSPPVMVIATPHQWCSPWLTGCALHCWFTYILEEDLHLFLPPPPSVSSGLWPIFTSLHWKAAVYGYPTPLVYLNYNLIQSCLLHQPTNFFNNILHTLKSCKVCLNSGRHLCHIPFRQFTDTSSQAAVMLLLPFKMMNEHQQPLIVLSDLSKTQGLVEVIGFNGC